MDDTQVFPDIPISILTPVYNRTRWLPLMISNIQSFLYDKKLINWYILDSKDGEEDIRLFTAETLEQTRKAIYPSKLIYEYRGRKMTIAEKRNHLVKNCPTKWWANMDSDDIYMDSYLRYSLHVAKSEKVELVGSPQMIFIFPHYDYKITAIQCEAVRQCHEATMLGTKKYIKSMGGFTKRDLKGEGASVIDGNEKNVRKTECAGVMICVAHNTNTCSKESFKGINVQDAKIQGVKLEILKEIMKDEVECGFQENAEFKSAPTE